MDDFKIIYRILSTLEKSMSIESPDMTAISAEYLGITVPKWARIMWILVKEGLIDGVIVVEMDNAPYPFVRTDNASITLKGLQYLQENSKMRKAANIAKGIREILP